MVVALKRKVKNSTFDSVKMDIKHLKHTDISKKDWDKTILNSKYGTVYAMSLYLDIVSQGWEALVNEDYSILMPLPVKTKYGFKYLTQPFYSQQLGVFSKNEIDELVFNQFMKSISYKFYRLQLNRANCFSFTKEVLKPNYVLELNKSYEVIQSKYGQNCKRNLKKSVKEKQKPGDNISPDVFLNFVETNLVFKPIKGVMPVLKSIIRESFKNGSGKIISVVDDTSDEILAAVFLLSWKNRFYYLMPASSEKGKIFNSMFFLVDQFIQQYAASDKIIDFEGSSIEGVARFYKGFGAQAEYYPVLNQNNLVFPFNKIIK
ncbi:MAG: hypothetical protein C0596_03345 [Marinilabiliales bacterium]|nr:MAG: hypothetical protein C0596_03345 [Marinilabiliales bacterium]